MEVFERQELPKSWEWSDFSDWIDIQGGSQPAKKFFSDKNKEGYVRLYQIRDLGEKPVPVYVDKRKVSKFCSEGDILIGRYGASVGKVFWAKEGAYNVALVKILYEEGVFDKSFLFHFFKSQYFQRRLGLISKTAQDGFNKTDLSQIPVPVAPLNEQKRVVDRIEQLFSDLDKGEALLKTVQKQLATYRQSVLKAAVTGELTKDWREKNKTKLESGEKLLTRILESRRKNWNGKGKYKEPSALDTSSLPNLPQGWVWSNFDQISDVITKGSSPNWQGFEYTDQGIVFVRSQNVDWGFLSLDEKVFLPPAFNEKEKKSVIKSGDVLLNIVGASIGRTAVADERIDGANCNQAVAIIRLSKEISPHYACKYLLSSFAQNIIHSEKVDVARANFNLNQIAGLAVALPGKDEQEEIIQRIDKIFSQIDTFETLCEAELNRSAALRQSILKSAFSGKLVVQDPADEPTSELLERIKSGEGAKEKTKPKTKIKSKNRIKPKAETKSTSSRYGRKSRSKKSEAA